MKGPGMIMGDHQGGPKISKSELNGKENRYIERTTGEGEDKRARDGGSGGVVNNIPEQKIEGSNVLLPVHFFGRSQEVQEVHENKENGYGYVYA